MIEIEGQGHFTNKHGDTASDIHRYQRRTYAYVKSVAMETLLLPLNTDDKGGWTPAVLDVGASDGYLRHFFEQDGFQYDGIDPAPRADHVREDTIHGALSNRYGLLLYIHVFEHILTPWEEVGQIKRVLKDGGVVFFALPDSGSEWADAFEGHYFIYSERTLVRMLEKAGFSIFETLKIEFRDRKKELWVTAQKNPLSF